MKYYEKLIDKRIFDNKDVQAIVGGNSWTATSILSQYQKKGYIEKIKKNLYVAISMETGESVANRFEIGSRLASGGCISHHAAFEYYGYANQIMYTVQVTARQYFQTLTYNGYEYEYLRERISEGVEQRENGIRVTDIERTVLDSINDPGKAGGMAELFKCLRLIPYLDENKLLHYLDLYHKQFLYQKAGFFLELLKDDLKLSTDFFTQCKNYIHKSTRYLLPERSKDSCEYHRKWQLYVPKEFSRSAELEE